MKISFRRALYTIVLFYLFSCSLTGCGVSKIDVRALLDESVETIAQYGKSRKYIKAGIPLVYLTGTPYEIGLAHGKLCRTEILETHHYYLDIYEQLKAKADNEWLPLATKLERHIPREYILEMRGVAHGAGIDYEKILFLNTLTTLSQKGNCFAFSFQDTRGRTITARQADLSRKQRLWKKMLLYIIKPQKGNGFMALLNPGWVSGETGMNEMGLTVSENNISIDQTQWSVMPINHLSRYLLQYSNTIDDVERFLKTQAHHPVRLLFVSSPKGASIFELANNEMARVVMQGEFLAMANHAGAIPSKNITSESLKRLEFGNRFLREHQDNMTIETAIALVRTPRITWYWNPTVHNRQSIIFSPSVLDFWLAIPTDSNFVPASYGPYVGVNLRHELYGSGEKPDPEYFSAYGN